MVRRLRGSSFAASTGLLLVAQAWLLVAPVVHGAREVSGRRTAPIVAAFETSCAPDCREPGHQHHPHDPATCSSCRAAHAAVDVTRRASLDPAAELLIECVVAPRARLGVRCGAPPSVRGPPVPSFLA